MSSCNTVAPGIRWRRSRWGRTCPIALKEGKVIPGRPELCVGWEVLFVTYSVLTICEEHLLCGVKMSTNSHLNHHAASGTNCTSCPLLRLSRSLLRILDHTYCLQCPGLPAGLPSLDLRWQGRPLYVSFWLSTTTLWCLIWTNWWSHFWKSLNRRGLIKSGRRPHRPL